MFGKGYITSFKTYNSVPSRVKTKILKILFFIYF